MCASIVSSIQDGGYDSWGGTSMATPHVAGALALLLEKYPTETSTQIVARLYAAASTGATQGLGLGAGGWGVLGVGCWHWASLPSSNPCVRSRRGGSCGSGLRADCW